MKRAVAPMYEYRDDRAISPSSSSGPGINDYDDKSRSSGCGS